MAERTYAVELWDHEMGFEGDWSGELAREIIGGPNAGLSWRQVGLALRRLRGLGWSEVSVYVEREEVPH